MNFYIAIYIYRLACSKYNLTYFDLEIQYLYFIFRKFDKMPIKFYLKSILLFIIVGFVVGTENYIDYSGM